MAKPDWLSIEEISRLWGEETGSDPAALKQDLEEWFSAFIKQAPASQSLITGKSADTTNRLMGMLGARYLERQTFEAYCEERGHPKPRFWFSGRIEEPARGAPRHPEPAATEPEAMPPQPGEDSPTVSPAPDSDLAAVQTQIASMSERPKPPGFESRNIDESSAGDQTDSSSQHGRSEPSTEQIHQELSERAEAASAEARQLEAQLQAAERRIADLSAAAQASRIPSPVRSSAPDPDSPNATSRGPATSSSFERRHRAGYQDPSATGQRLRKGARRKGRGKAKLMAGLAVSLGAVVALLYWGSQTVLQTTDSARLSAQPETGALSSDPASGTLGPIASVASADAQDLAAARRQIARLTAAVEASDSEAARLRDELAIARQMVETARQTQSAEAESQADKQHRNRALAAAEEAANLRAALAGAEQKIATLDTQLQAARGATSDARAETAGLQAALQQAEDRTEAELRGVSLAATVSAARIAELQRDLASARQQIADLGRERSAASANVSGLRASLQKAREETEALREELKQEVTAASTQLAMLRNELRAAQRRIDELSDAAEAAEDEAAELREELAGRHQEEAATGLPSTEPIDAKESVQGEESAEQAAKPEIDPATTAAINPSDPGSGGFEQVAALAPNEAALQTDAIADTVSPDDLLLAPGRHLGQEVVVTGSVVWLLWRYRLQSISGSDSIVVDVHELQPAAQQELEKAIDRVGILGEVQARIRGTVLRRGDDGYRLAASELVLVE